MANAPHHQHPLYRRLAPIIRAQANANPHTICQAPVCKGWGNRTLAEHPTTRTGKPARWQAGHKVDGQMVRTLADLQPEADVCNQANGASAGNRNRELHTPW